MIDINDNLIDDQIYQAYKLRMLGHILGEQGVSIHDFLEGTGLTEKDINSASTRVSRRQQVTTYLNTIKLSKDPTIGLLTGERLHMSEYGVYGYGLISSANLKEAIEFSIKYHRMASPTVEMSFYLDNETAVYAMKDIIEVDRLKIFNIELQISLVLTLFKDMMSNSFIFDEIRVMHSEPAHSDQYERLFNCPIKFNQNANELRFKNEWLNVPLIRANPITAELTQEICDQILNDMATFKGLAHDVNRVILNNLKKNPDIEFTANLLNLSPRTLRRKLAHQGTTFQKMLNEIRKQLAIIYLHDNKMNTENISEELGFSDAANFRHAFKKWTNKSPQKYRDVIIID